MALQSWNRRETADHLGRVRYVFLGRDPTPAADRFLYRRHKPKVDSDLGGVRAGNPCTFATPIIDRAPGNWRSDFPRSIQRGPMDERNLESVMQTRPDSGNPDRTYRPAREKPQRLGRQEAHDES